ncbi:MAG: 4-hydroxybenzoate octaprenyltransferase, partial [Bdellovibrionales bacterium]
HAIWVAILFGVGAIVMRAAGCVINDIWDRDLDKKVERTRVRPLAAETLPLKNAFLFLCGLLVIGLLVLLQMNGVTIVLGLLSLPMIVAYPFMKRITWWPQAFLGLTFNFGALMGWSAMDGALALPALLLYAGGIFWTLGYDTIYAHQDKDDDLMAGIKSTALKFGEDSLLWVRGFYALAFVFMMAAFVMQAGWLGLAVLPAGWHLYSQLQNWQPDNAQSSLDIFKSNRDFGLIVFAAAIGVAVIQDVLAFY